MPIHGYDYEISPAEQMRRGWETEDREARYAQEKEIAQFNVDTKKLEIQLRQEDASKSRIHQQTLKQIELQIKQEQNRWEQIFRLPVLLVRLPVMLVMAIGFCIAIARGEEIDPEYWKYLR